MATVALQHPDLAADQLDQAVRKMTVEGVGFISDSVVRVDGVSVPTTFVNIRTLKTRIPAGVVASRPAEQGLMSRARFSSMACMEPHCKDHRLQSAPRRRNFQQRVLASAGQMVTF